MVGHNTWLMQLAQKIQRTDPFPSQYQFTLSDNLHRFTHGPPLSIDMDKY